MNPAVLFSDTRQFLAGVKAEFGKVTWPSKDEEINASVVVVVTVIIMMVFIVSVDSIFLVVRDLVYPGT